MKNQLHNLPLKLVILLFAPFLLWNCQTTPDPATKTFPINQEITSEDGELILVGQLNREAWQKESYKDWFDYEYVSYEVEESTLSALNMKDISFKVFLGTWCSDSQREVPHFYKVMDYLGMKDHHFQVIALDNHPDRYKQSPQQEEEGWNIEYVPTIIILKEGIEIGRIVESPEVSLEKDLRDILKKLQRIVS